MPNIIISTWLGYKNSQERRYYEYVENNQLPKVKKLISQFLSMDLGARVLFKKIDKTPTPPPDDFVAILYCPSR